MGERGHAVPKSQPPPPRKCLGERQGSQLPSPRMDFTTSGLFWESQRGHLGEQPQPATAAETREFRCRQRAQAMLLGLETCQCITQPPPTSPPPN